MVGLAAKKAGKAIVAWVNQRSRGALQRRHRRVRVLVQAGCGVRATQKGSSDSQSSASSSTASCQGVDWKGAVVGRSGSDLFMSITG